MMDLCGEGEFGLLQRKMNKAIGKFARKIDGFKSIFEEDSEILMASRKEDRIDTGGFQLKGNSPGI